MQENNGWTIIEAEMDDIPLSYKELNALIREAIRKNHRCIKLMGVFGQRFIAAGLECSQENLIKLEVNGIPGNDLGIFMDGPQILVKGNAEDQLGNTMNEGLIVVEGDCRDVAGLSMRGGKIFVRGNAGYRIGIHMKEYREKIPIIVIGGVGKEFFGEYMAGGLLVALGVKYEKGYFVNSKRVVSPNIGNGIHGGEIIIRGEVPDEYLGVGAVKMPFSEEDHRTLEPIIAEFCKYFNVETEFIWDATFWKIIPGSHRPFAAYYTAKPI